MIQIIQLSNDNLQQILEEDMIFQHQNLQSAIAWTGNHCNIR